MFICSLTLLGGDLKSWCSCYIVKLIYLGRVALLERLTKKQKKKLGELTPAETAATRAKITKTFMLMMVWVVVVKQMAAAGALMR